MQDILEYLEAHSGLFVALGGIATVLGFFIGMFFQYRRAKRQRHQLELKSESLQGEQLRNTATIAKMEVEAHQAQAAAQDLDGERTRLAKTLEIVQLQNRTTVEQ